MLAIKQESRQAPTGVKVLSLVAVALGVVMTIGGLVILALSPFVSFVLAQVLPSLTEEELSKLPTVFSTIGIALTAAAGITLPIGIGLTRGKRWAWIMALAVSLLAIAIGVLEVATGHPEAVGIMSIIGTIVYYLFTPNVRKFFSRRKMRPHPSPVQDSLGV